MYIVGADVFYEYAMDIKQINYLALSLTSQTTYM